MLGGGLFLYKVVLGPTHTSVTQDSDFTIQHLSVAQIPAALGAVLAIASGDELSFDANGVVIQPIMATNPQLGLRARMDGHLGHSLDRITLDLSLDTVPWPGPQWRNVPGTLPQQPAVRLLTHPLEGVMAGKVEGMLRRGATNTRYKDYFDIARLAQTQDFGAATLDRALRDMCAQHQTPFVPNTVFLDPSFPTDTQQLSGWQSFVTTISAPGGACSMPAFADVIELLQRLYLPILQGSAGITTWSHQTGRWQ